MHDFGYNTYMTILVPGVIVSLAFYLILNTHYPDTEFFIWLQEAQAKEFLFTGLLVFSSSFFGAVLGSMLDFFEWKILDERAAKRLDISRESYDEEWRLYLNSLPSKDNSYIASRVLTFRFELRTAFALVLLVIALLLIPGYLVIVLILLASAVFLFYFAHESHYLLAYSRNRDYGEQARINLMQDTSEEQDG